MLNHTFSYQTISNRNSEHRNKSAFNGKCCLNNNEKHLCEMKHRNECKDEKWKHFGGIEGYKKKENLN